MPDLSRISFTQLPLSSPVSVEVIGKQQYVWYSGRKQIILEQDLTYVCNKAIIEK